MNANLKAQAAAAALEEVESGMRLGIGSGSTANEMIRLLAKKVASGFDVIGVPCSTRSEALCLELGVPLTTLDKMPELDLTIDGADEYDPALNLIKGGGAALLREKTVAVASARMIVIADDSKRVATLGQFPLPIEVNQFGLASTRIAIQKHFASRRVSGDLILRGGENDPVITDNGNYILDAHLGTIPDPAELAKGLNDIPGVVEHGLFIGIAKRAYIAGENGVAVVEPKA
ncbi:ribose-5-phosphate isomerase RpiA [Rhodobacteraceae bacterium RKSG542]|uniref:ribose-5-phosphate isomerase RpiA n=1 Tax=Pseudovibrio flavus TaxID=2529854 RepID=UPI0012BB96A8|nr:ribose-5-phosphate isomerase RpiA [Pseudovibrio flavus]MTI16741.1 ribose-5-phosphate isomerase RpiA [Pseudovibrio flavus]